MKVTYGKYALLTLLGINCISATVYAQVHAPILPGNSLPATASETYRQNIYGTAYQTGNQYNRLQAAKLGNNDPIDADKARYAKAISALKTNYPNAVADAEKAINQTANPSYAQRLSNGVAQYNFRKDNYAEAIKKYEEAGIANLENDEIGDQKFELAYCYFNNKQFDKAKPLFAAIKELNDSKYYIAGNYYYGLLCYNENKYDEALKCFEKVKNEQEYKSVVPYYIAELYYYKGNRERALSIADTLIKQKEKSYYHKELHLLAAQCLLDNKDYYRAKPYFEYYYKNSDKLRKDELYKIAYTYYKLDEWKNATEKLRMLSDAQDSLGQTAMYLLGDCYLKTGSKNSARNAFGICSEMNFNPAQQEASMILYARLSLETGKTDDALRAVNKLMTTYPSSQYRDEAQTLASDLSLKTGNYDEALKKLSDVKKRDVAYYTVYQRASYGSGVQALRNGELNKADEHFANSLTNPINAEYERAAYFWRGEIAYQQKKYTDAINYEQNFISRMGDINIVERISPQSTIQHAYLTMGYAAKETDNFVAAQDYFNQAQLAKNADKHSSQVALVQEADAVFMQRNYSKAATLYDKIAATGGSEADYARYQKAVILGLQSKNNEKITALNAIIKSSSPYASQAKYELALTYVEMEKWSMAITALKQITDGGTDQGILPKAWMKSGFVYQQTNDNAKAIEAYKQVVLRYPGSEERFAALEALKSLYIQTNQPSGYSQLLKEGNLPNAETGSLDSTYYAAGEAQFAANSWDNARTAFTNYLRQYPNGIFAVKAYYYRGESNYKLKKYSEAKDDYGKVLETPWNDFSEGSARRAAAIAMELRDYENAKKYYGMLRSNAGDYGISEQVYRGLMRSNYNTGNVASAGNYADTLLQREGISIDAQTEGQFYKARANQDAGNDATAMESFKTLAASRNGEIAAESRYRTAEILLKQNKLKEAEDATNECIRLSAGYDNWVGKSYMLLADILVKQEDYFNAKALLQSIVKNTKIAELKQEATRKLAEVKQAEKSKSKLSEE